MKKLNAFLLLTTVLILSACSSDKLPKFTVIQGLRVLAIESDVPEVNFDGATFTPNTVNITPLVSDLFGSGRALSYNLEWCLDAGIALGAAPNCAGNPTRTVVKSSATVASTGGSTFVTPNFTGTVDADAVDLSLASAPALAVIAARFSAATSAQLFNGLNLLVVYEIFPTAEPSTKITSLKRIVFSSSAKTTKNANPTGLEIRLAGAEITGLPSVESSMEAFLPSVQAESYSLLNADGTVTAKTEVLETTWFLTGPSDVECSKKKDCTSDGLFLMSRTRVGEFNTFYIPLVATPTTRGRVLIAVARDDRGGVMTKRYCTGVSCP